MTTAAVPTMMIHTSGPITSAERAYAQRKIADAQRFASAPVRCTKVELRAETNPSWERPALAKATVDVNGLIVRAHADATTMFAAIDALEARLRRRLK